MLPWCWSTLGSIFARSFLRGGFAGEGKAGNATSVEPEVMRVSGTLVKLKKLKR